MNHKKYVKKEEEKSILQKEYYTQRDKAIKEHEKYEKELDEAIKRKKEKDFINNCILQRKNEEMKEKKIKEFQEKIFERHKEWESKNFEHMEKVENMYQQKHNLAVNEYCSILKKDIIRHEKIEERKNQFDLKKQDEINKIEELKINLNNNYEKNNFSVNKNFNNSKSERSKKQKNRHIFSIKDKRLEDLKKIIDFSDKLYKNQSKINS